MVKFFCSCLLTRLHAGFLALVFTKGSVESFQQIVTEIKSDQPSCIFFSMQFRIILSFMLIKTDCGNS